MVLYLATTNPGKLRDFAHALTPGVTLGPLPGLHTLPAPDETADTFEGNARLKAEAYSNHRPGLLVLADDSGLEVDALNRAPGVRSARYAADLQQALGCNAPGLTGLSPAATTDERNNAALLAALYGTPEPRTGRYRCTLALARNGVTLLTADGTCEGQVLAQPRGSSGFGYDPLFLVTPFGRTMAELTPGERQQISHRAAALRALLPRVERLALESLTP